MLKEGATRLRLRTFLACHHHPAVQPSSRPPRSLYSGFGALLLLLVACLTLIAILPGTASTARSQKGCDRFADPGGSDRSPGTKARPLRSAQALADSLQPGETGCLRGGSYRLDDEIRVSTPGVTLKSFRGERAVLRGRLWVTQTANDATISHLDLDGRNSRGLPSPTINGDGVTLAHNDITNRNTGICVSIGSPQTYGRAERTVVKLNEIHHCGTLPATNFDHGIYVNSADDTVIKTNLIYDNADRGIQLYPDSQRTMVIGNVIRNNGQGVLFGGDEDSASSGNVVIHNLIVGSTIRNNVESSWAGPVGSDNVVRDNCIGRGAYDDGDAGIAGDGFTALGNVLAIPGRAQSCVAPIP